MVSGRTRDRQQLLHSSRELPCILMAADPQPSDIYQGIQLGAVDFLAKPLSPLKLRNIWQHTVRKMMSDMSIQCSFSIDGSQQQQEGSEQMSEDESMEDMEALIAAEMAMLEGKAAEQYGCSNSPMQCSSPIPEGALSRAASAAAVLDSASLPSSPQQSLSRSFSVNAISHPSPSKPPRPTTASGRPAVHSCPSTLSLKSTSTSCRSSYTATAAPGSPSNTTSSAPAGQEFSSSMSMGELCSMASGSLDPAQAGAAAAGGCGASSSCCQARSKVKKAVRHLASANVANRPPLAIKPHTLAPAVSSPAAPAAAAQPAAAASALSGASPMGIPMGMAAVPLPTGLGPLPHGMVWGMPMCPLARAPGIVPPSATPPAMPWGMSAPGMMPGACGPMSLLSPMGPMPPFMAGFPMMAGSMAVALPPGMAMAPGMPMLSAASAMVVPAAMAAGVDPLAAPAAVAATAEGPQPGTGAAVAAALDASLACCNAGAVGGLEHGSLHDFMLGDVTAEDDDDLGVLAFKSALPEHFNQLADELETKAHGLCALEGPLGPALDGDMAAEADKVGLCLTGYNISQQRESGECYSSLQRQASMSSARSSFESVSSGLCGPIRTTLMGSAAGAASAGKLGMASFGSFSDLFAAGREDSPESSDEQMTRNDSSQMLAELESLFGHHGCHNEGSDGGLFEGLELPMALA